MLDTCKYELWYHLATVQELTRYMCLQPIHICLLCCSEFHTYMCLCVCVRTRSGSFLSVLGTWLHKSNVGADIPSQ